MAKFLSLRALASPSPSVFPTLTATCKSQFEIMLVSLNYETLAYVKLFNKSKYFI